jgi:guanine nucleotide-binding protein G(I)/G(S)/G(T) subunit beta-1
MMKDTSLDKYGTSVAHLTKDGCNLKLCSTLKGHQNKIAQFRWSPDSAALVTCSQDGYIIVWDAITGFKTAAITLENQWVLTCGYSPNGGLVASAGLDNVCTVYRLQAPECSMYGDNEYSMFGIMTNCLSAVFKGHTAYVSECDFLNNSQLVSGSGDMTCVLWDINKGCKICGYNEHLGDVLCVSPVNSNPNMFLSGSSDGYVNIWDIRQAKSVYNYFTTNSDVTCLKNFNDGNSFICGRDDGNIRLVDLRSDCELNTYNLMGRLPATRKSFDGANSIISTSSYDIPGVMSIDVSKSYRLMYACYADYGCVIWDLVKNELIGTIGSGHHQSKINQVGVSSDGLGVATASWDSTIRIWSV